MHTKLNSRRSSLFRPTAAAVAFVLSCFAASYAQSPPTVLPPGCKPQGTGCFILQAKPCGTSATCNPCDVTGTCGGPAMLAGWRLFAVANSYGRAAPNAGGGAPIFCELVARCNKSQDLCTRYGPLGAHKHVCTPGGFVPQVPDNNDSLDTVDCLPLALGDSGSKSKLPFAFGAIACAISAVWSLAGIRNSA
jgi:hypothetical protein